MRIGTVPFFRKYFFKSSNNDMNRVFNFISPVVVFSCCSLVIIVVMALTFAYNRSYELSLDIEYLQKENATLKTLLKTKAVMSNEDSMVQAKYDKYVQSVIKDLEEKQVNLEYRKLNLKD